MRRALLSMLVMTLAACPLSSDSGTPIPFESELFHQAAPEQLDVLWVVDNTPSMAQEQEMVAHAFPSFLAALDLDETGIDLQLGVVTTDIDETNHEAGVLLGGQAILHGDSSTLEDDFAVLVQVGVEGSDLERGLEAAYLALTSPLSYQENAGFLRDEAMLAIAFLSDENDCSDRGALPENASGMACYDQPELLVDTSVYVDDFAGLKTDRQQVLPAAIVGPEDHMDCEDTVPGTRYIDVAEAFGGVVGTICADSYEDELAEMGRSVSGQRRSFLLHQAPVVGSIEVYLCTEETCDEEVGAAVTEDESEGWSFDPDTNILTFHGSSVPPRGWYLLVRYYAEESNGTD